MMNHTRTSAVFLVGCFEKKTYSQVWTVSFQLLRPIMSSLWLIDLCAHNGRGINRFSRSYFQSFLWLQRFNYAWRKVPLLPTNVLRPYSQIGSTCNLLSTWSSTTQQWKQKWRMGERVVREERWNRDNLTNLFRLTASNFIRRYLYDHWWTETKDVFTNRSIQ